jgi:hypothetical protein
MELNLPEKIKVAVEDTLRKEVLLLNRKLRRAIKQRDEANGRAKELMGYVTKYQKELASMRKELRENA